ncbi:acetyltransferase [Burkholderia sp. Leaf177]|uniref:acyltransferase n=1 Tax=Burkholderia sp. Leaf177 TaxID=1736287 RepID=UPI0006FB4629|nr:acyltransferase [Burkholderia sp. Leaf177]KQR78359.1 acetyltransferase [Burkholderia sp. Leaf177]
MKKVLIRGLSQLKSLFVGLSLRADNVGYESAPVFSGKWPKITNKGRIYIAENCSFRSFRTRQHITVTKDAILEIGRNTFMNDGANLCATLSVKIGRNCKIGDMTYIYDTDFHQVSPQHPTKRAPISIGNNVWIGARSTILAGADIGDHSVIAAGSTVVGEIPAKSLAGGSPARVIRTLDVPDDWIRD